jgi:hypothetical protein
MPKKRKARSKPPNSGTPDKVTKLDEKRLDAELPTNADIDVRREFAEAERAGTEPLTKEFLRKVRGSGSTPEVSAMDVDADWERADPVGEETVGGTVATPEQDVVDYIGDAVGVTYPEETPVTPTEKVEERDRHRWELDPASSEDYPERSREIASGKADRREAESEEESGKEDKAA